jgi:hypothetical protein
MTTDTTTTLPPDKFDTSMTFVRPENPPARVPLDQLSILPGFNTRVKDAEYSLRVTAIAESIQRHGFFADKPFAVTQIPGDDTIYIFDGEHRFDAARAASLDGVEFPDGLPVAWAPDGATVKDLTIHLVHGNNAEKLNPVEMAAVVRRLKTLGMDKEEIGNQLGYTPRHVDNLFVLAGANATVKKAVAGGQIAAAEAVKLLRKDPKEATTKITEAIKAAEERGKKKATPKTMAETSTVAPTKTIRVEVSMAEGEKMSVVLQALAKQVREHVRIGSDDKLLEDGKLAGLVTVVDHEALDRRKAAAEERERKAAERAAAKAEREKAAKAKKAAAAKAKAAKAKKPAAAKGSTAKATGAKKGSTGKAAGTKATAAKGSGTKAAGKAAGTVKAAGAPQKPASADSGSAATSTPPKGESTPSEAPAATTDENNGL